MSDDLLFVPFILFPLFLGLLGTRRREWLLYRQWIMVPCIWVSASSLIWLARSSNSLAIENLSQPGIFFVVDPVSSLILTLVLFLTVVLLRYSCRHLEDDPKQGQFFRAMGLCLSGVVVMVGSSHLLTYLLAWLFVSSHLDRLLRHYSDPQAQLGARQKFWVSRAGDVLLIIAIGLLFAGRGTTAFADFAGLAQDNPQLQTWVVLLLVLGALSKSAQVPFHYWLPNTMNTPVPVSALMHAGIINSGGVLLLKSSHLLKGHDLAQSVLIIFALISLVLAMLVMLIQPDVKRSLAYSTIGQMGFMFLQISLGAYGFALIHILGHGLYKAHAFLSAGSALQARPILKMIETNREVSWGRKGIVGLVLVLLTLSPLISQTQAFGFQFSSAQLVLFSVFILAGCQLVMSGQSLLSTLSTLGALALGYGLLSLCIGFYAQGYFPAFEMESFVFTQLMIGSFITLFLVNNSLTSLSKTWVGQFVYMQLFHGEFLGKLKGRPHVL